MCKKTIHLLLALVFGLALSASAANIIWVSDAYDELADNIPDDMGFVEFLEANGYTVDYTQGASFGNGFWRTLDDDKIASLNAADLIVVVQRELDRVYAGISNSLSFYGPFSFGPHLLAKGQKKTCFVH